MPATRITLRDVAADVGVSISTVSLALRDSPRISEDMRARVRDAADRLGYRQDILGSLLRAQDPRVIGLLCRLDQEVHFTYHEHIRRIAEARGCRLVVESVSAARPAPEAFAVLEQFRSMAVIVVDAATAAGLDPSTTHTPVLTIGQVPLDDEGALVVSDNTVGISEVVDHLADLGHRRLVHFAGPEGPSSAVRERALRECAHEAGLGVDVVPAGSDVDAGFAAARSLLARRSEGGELPTAIVSYNDHCAHGALLALARAGVSVPGEVSLVGFDDTRLAGSAALSLTTVSRAPEEVAERSITAVLRLARSSSSGGGGAGRRPRIRESVPTHLVVRTSTGPARTR